MPLMTCHECGGPIYEDESPGVLLHENYDGFEGADLDADHTALDSAEFDEPDELQGDDLDAIADGANYPDSDLW